MPCSSSHGRPHEVAIVEFDAPQVPMRQYSSRAARCRADRVRDPCHCTLRANACRPFPHPEVAVLNQPALARLRLAAAIARARVLLALLAPLAALVLSFAAGAGTAAATATPASIHVGAGSFQRAFTPLAGQLDTVRKSGTLKGVPGWFEYDFSIAASGWYELVLDGHGIDLEYVISPRSDGAVHARQVGSYGFDGATRTDKVGNFWLPAGQYTLRLQREYWTGFPDVRGFWIRPAATTLAGTLRIAAPHFNGVYRLRGCPPLVVQYGPRAQPVVVDAILVNALTSQTLRTERIELPATAVVTTLHWRPPCNAPGLFVVYFRNAAEGFGVKHHRDVHPVTYQVIDPAPPPAAGAWQRTLVQSIDVVATAPDFEQGNGRIVEAPFGRYRESDRYGWERRQHGGMTPGPSWFAYTIRNLQPQTAYVVEIDYPDDAERTFAIALREPRPLAYPVAGGVDSGGEFALTHRMQTHTLLFWPRSDEARVVLLPAHDGTTAAAAAIRVFRIDGELPPLARGAGGRRFFNWYEEGSNFLSMYGAPDHWFDRGRVAAERWAQTAAHMGITTLSPTVVIYEFGLYPSRVNRYFSRQAQPDMLRQILLAAERHGLGVVPDLHPRADEVSWPFLSEPDPKPNLLVSRTGQTVKGVPPFFNPLHPVNRQWYLDLIGELADNYRDSPSFHGISLRLMGWRNPTLHNFHDLDWGYDDYTVSLFRKETGVAVPGHDTDPARFAQRHQFLTTTERARWIDWRTRKVTEILTQIRDRVRKARPDLRIYVPVFPMTVAGSTYRPNTNWIVEAGFDVQRLRAIDGLVLVNALHAYGRRFLPDTPRLLRNNLMDPAIATVLTGGEPGGAYLPYALYFEAIGSVATPAQLGFPANTRVTWMSATVNPSGRNFLERFATLLGRHDAQMLGDGGNAYTIGQPVLREFLAEYLRIPERRFTRRSATPDPIAVWDWGSEDGYFFYAVNTTSRPAQVRIRLTGTGTVERLSSGAPVTLRGGSMALRLEPFQLMAFRSVAGTRMTEVFPDALAPVPPGR
jgi:hypothetical protein